MRREIGVTTDERRKEGRQVGRERTREKGEKIAS